MLHNSDNNVEALCKMVDEDIEELNNLLEVLNHTQSKTQEKEDILETIDFTCDELLEMKNRFNQYEESALINETIGKIEEAIISAGREEKLNTNSK